MARYAIQADDVTDGTPPTDGSHESGEGPAESTRLDERVAELLIFKNDDAGFRSWVRKHPGGLLVNVPNLMLHHPDCDHISDLMTKAAKACADGPSPATELRLWAQKERASAC